VPSFTGRFVIAARAPLPDNSRVSLDKPAAMPQPIFFAHAKGFRSATYGKFFAAMGPD